MIAISMPRATTQRVALHVLVKTDTRVMENSVKVCMAKTMNTR